MHRVFYVTGVSGSGKTTIGEALSERLRIPFYDSDLFHPQANIEKMSAGIPLTDEDRLPWLRAIHDFAKENLSEKSMIIATSALKASYRRILEQDLNSDQVVWIYLYGTYELLYQRISDRKGHFMKESMLRSQFEALEVPRSDRVIDVDVDQTVTEIVDEIVARTDDPREQDVVR